MEWIYIPSSLIRWFGLYFVILKIGGATLCKSKSFSILCSIGVMRPMNECHIRLLQSYNLTFFVDGCGSKRFWSSWEFLVSDGWERLLMFMFLIMRYLSMDLFMIYYFCFSDHDDCLKHNIYYGSMGCPPMFSSTINFSKKKEYYQALWIRLQVLWVDYKHYG
jgi:hypothetical protein